MSRGEDAPKKSGLVAPWEPGKSGNPLGRPKGARNKLTEAFWSDLYGAWLDHGASAIRAMIEDKPGDFVKVVASQMPKEFLVNTGALNEISDEDLAEFIATLRHLASAGNTKKGRNGTSETAH